MTVVAGALVVSLVARRALSGADASAPVLEPRRAARDARSTDPEAARLADELRANRLEIDALRAEVARLEGLLAEPPARSVVEESAPIVESASPRPAETTVSPETVACLQRLRPDTYGAFTAEAMACVRELDLRGVEVSDDDLARLAGLPALAHLGLRGTAITDVGLASLAACPGLEALDLRGTAVTGLGVSQLDNPRLASLHLTGTRVSSADLHLLPPLPELRVLKLNALDVGDEAVHVIARHPTLQHLELDGTRITDDGLARLLSLLPSLTRVELRNTRVTRAFAEDLAALYPGCEIVL